MILLVILYALLMQFIDAKQKEHEARLCSFLENAGPRIETFQSIDKVDAKIILEEAFWRTEQSGWESRRHANYPTTDIEVVHWSTKSNRVVHKIVSQARRRLAGMFHVDPAEIVLKEAFVAKYTPDGQKRLALHQDGSEFSFIVALNDKFSGGGTFFALSRRTVRLGVGECVVFSGKTYHAGLEVTSGERYILAGFLNYKYADFCDGDDNVDDDSTSVERLVARAARHAKAHY
tara:strand:+ start:30057 stop:30755 length:699 start_codon:yes stop_codon:yes gene_type:complete